MRRRYAHVPAAENPLRPKAPKSPWSRRILFPAPSGHFRIVLFLIGLIGCLCLFSPGLSFRLSVLFRSLSGFRFLWFRSSVFIGGLCVPSVFSYPLLSDGSLVAFVFRRRFFHWGVHVVRPSPGFLYRFVRILFMALSFLLLSRSSFVFPFPAFPSSSFSPSRPFPSRGLRVPFRFVDFDCGPAVSSSFSIPPLRITSSQCAIGRRRRAYRPRSSASSRTASSRVAWRRWSR